jgi:hypothetical protein
MKAASPTADTRVATALLSPACCLAAAVASLALLGCSSGPKRIAAPDVSPAGLASRIISDYDADGNGSASKTELEKVRSLIDRFAAYDADNSGELSESELETGLNRVFDGRTGVMGAYCKVTRNDKPLSGAIVYFVPEAFFDDALEVAGGVTAADGVARMSIPIENLPANAPKQQGLVQPGLYFVEVKHPSLTIPEQYNTKTILGKEVSPEITIGGPIQVALKF